MEASQTRQQALEQRIKELETDNKKKDDELTEYRDQLAVSAAAAANAGGEKNALLLWLQREKRAIEEQRKQDHEFHQLALDKLQTAFNQKESWYARIISRLDEVIGGQKMPAGGEAATDTQNGTPGCFNSSPPRDSRWIPSMSTPAPAVAPSEDRFATLTDIDIEYSPLGKTLSEAMDEEPSSNGVPLDTEPASRRQSYGIDENYSDGHDDEDDKPTSYNTRQSYDIDENYSDGHDDEYDGPTGHAAGQHTYPNDTNGDGDKEMSGEPDNNAHNSEDHEDTMGMTSFNIDFALADPQLARDILGESQIADTSEGHEFINQQLARHGVPTLASILGLGSILRQVTNSPSTSNDRHVEEYGNVDKDELPNATAQANAPQTPAQRARVPGDFRSSASRLEPPSSTWSSAVARGLITQNTPGMPGIQVIPPTPEQGGNDNADGRVGHSYHDETGHPEQPEENEGGDASETFQGSFDNAFPGYRYSDE
jgi:hypothetical protein